MRFAAIEDSQINLTSVNMATGEADTSVDLKHSKDGVTWTQYDFNPIPLAAGETLYLKGNNENGLSNGVRFCSFGDGTNMGIPNTPSTGKFECHGNIMSLLYGDDFEDKTTIPSVGCFYSLFSGCSSLTTAPELPATTLADRCYYFMFANCTSLTTAPELPATTLSERCYAQMFNSCTSLTTAPELPATTLVKACYTLMFSSCTSLTTAPVLPATILVEQCYDQMFYHSTNLNHITMLATDISAKYCLSGWVDGVSSTGTFVKHPDMDSLPTGVSGIPNGWTVIDCDFKN